MLKMTLIILGAVLTTLSIILAVIKLREYYFNRFRIKAAFSFGYQENSLLFTNLSAKPITITYYELYWKNPHKEKRVIDVGIFEDGCLITIPPYCSESLKFDEQYYFSSKNDNKLYVTLHIVGRKKITKLLA